MRQIVWILVLVALTGCGTVSGTKIDLRSAAPTIALQDDRTEMDRVTRKERKSYGQITYYGDDKISPPPPQLLASWLGERFSAPLKGKRVSLREFSIEVEELDATINEQQFQNVVQSTPGAGPVTASIAHWLVGSFEKAKLPKTVYVNISGKIDGRDFSAGAKGAFKSRVTAEDLNSIITRALDAAVVDVQRVLSSEDMVPNQTAQPTSTAVTPPTASASRPGEPAGAGDGASGARGSP
ncbi:MAG TPA: hypothetical protein VLW52_11970 [Opitutaceae bacterium]|nr:hypothetical protein [Opitutaceae bacterium]